MQQMYDIDINEAHKGYVRVTGMFSYALYVQQQDDLNPRNSSFSAYSPAYISSNEQVREIIRFIQPAGKTALAVAGSGDMPLFLTAYDAVHVDTFDISYNARVIMDIKTYMLKNQMFFCDYMKTLAELKNTKDILNSRAGSLVHKAVSGETLKYLDGMRGCKIFSRSVVDEIGFWPNAMEFDALQQKVNEPYKFIWSDLFDVCGQIKGQSYDIIYLSNIFQYMDNVKDIVNILNSLRGSLNSGGVIVLDSLLPSAAIIRMQKYRVVGQVISSWAELVYDEKAMSLFLKTK